MVVDRSRLDGGEVVRVHPYPWPDAKKCAVAINVLFDDGLDAVAKAPDLAERSKSFSVWEYGARRGVERLLSAFSKASVVTTWFIPGFVAEKHRSLVSEIVASGHEVAARGWSFERYDRMTAPERASNLARSRDALQAVAGATTNGFRLPNGNWPSRFDVDLRAAGFKWSASLNGDDRPYWHRSGLVEIPVHLELEDRPYFQFNFNPPFPKGLSRLPSYEGVLDNWRTEFNAYREFGLCFVPQLRPEMIGTPGRIFILTELLAHIASFNDVWMARSSEIACWHSEQGLRPESGHPLEVFASYRREHGFDE